MSMCRSRKFCQRGSNFYGVFFGFFSLMSDEERKDPNTTISGPAKRHLNDGPTLNAGLVAVIFQGIRTSIA